MTTRARRADAGARAGEEQAAVRLLERANEEAVRLRKALDESRGAVERSQRLAELRLQLDVDELAARVADAAMAVNGVDAVMLAVFRPKLAPLVTTYGLSADEEALAPIDSTRPIQARTIEIALRHGNGDRRGQLVRAFVLPLRRDEESEPVGTLTVFSRAESRPIGGEELQTLEELTRLSAAALENARRFEEARDTATRDSLTGVYNRAFFHEELAREVTRAVRYRRPLTLVMLDIDGFKQVNEQLGHLEADAVLAEVAVRVASSVRAADVVGRVGGDELCVILPEADREDARRLFDRLSQTMGGNRKLTRVPVTLSAGIAELRLPSGPDLAPVETPASLFGRAERALRDAKRSGGGVCRVANFDDAPAAP